MPLRKSLTGVSPTDVAAQFAVVGWVVCVEDAGVVGDFPPQATSAALKMTKRVRTPGETAEAAEKSNGLGGPKA